MSISQAFHLLKGASSHELFKQKPKFRLRYSGEHSGVQANSIATIDADAETTINIDNVDEIFSPPFSC